MALSAHTSNMIMMIWMLVMAAFMVVCGEDGIDQNKLANLKRCISRVLIVISAYWHLHLKVLPNQRTHRGSCWRCRLLKHISLASLELHHLNSVYLKTIQKHSSNCFPGNKIAPI